MTLQRTYGACIIAWFLCVGVWVVTTYSAEPFSELVRTKIALSVANQRAHDAEGAMLQLQIQRWQGEAAELAKARTDVEKEAGCVLDWTKPSPGCKPQDTQKMQGRPAAPYPANDEERSESEKK